MAQTHNYKASNVEQAHWWMVKAVDTAAEAEALIPSGQTRLGAYNRLYYAVHHAAVSLLRLIGNKSKTHSSIKGQFGLQWVKRRGFPPTHGKLIGSLHTDRTRADYGEYVPSLPADLEKQLRKVKRFIVRANREVPSIGIHEILTMVIGENEEIRDFSFDFYCPKSYFHHTRMTIWSPKGRVGDGWVSRICAANVRTLKALGIEEPTHYVLGLNSRVNQYEERHLVMLDFDDVGSVPVHRLKKEPGFLFRTQSGYHFIGGRTYEQAQWEKRMRRYSKFASKQHCELSMKRGYATLRLTQSPRKPFTPVYIGRTEG